MALHFATLEITQVDKGVAAEALKASREVRQVVYQSLRDYLNQGI